MKLSLYISLFAAVVGVVRAQDINTSQQRTATLDLARSLLTTQPFIEGAVDLEQKNPFNPRQPIPEQASDTYANVTTLADKELLIQLTNQVMPSGSMQLGSEALLLFGQKKFKVGEVLSISFQGATYELVISAIERTNFTLRLNNEEITRPIKPVTSKP